MKSVRYRTLSGVRPALVITEGRKFITMIWMDAAGIRLHKVPNSEARYMEPSPIQPTKFKRALLSAGRAFGITKGARAALRG
jgi:hypothetical protein